jgi:HAD superfamily hydrolase (TIGR01458 family)
MSGAPLWDVKGILFDLDGVVYIGDRAIPGAAETLELLNERGIPFRFVTNTTTQSPETLGRRMAAMGLPIGRDAILTTHEVAARYLAEMGRPTCHLLVSDDALPAYRGIPTSDVDPAYVVVGDVGERWNRELTNRVFNMMMDGAELIALHKGRYWRTGSGLQVDIGALVAGLEYSTGKTATVIGKPSATFFEMALKELGLPRQDVVMVGDDIETDIGGAQNAGIRGVLVKTGKYREDTLARSTVRPAVVVGSVADVQAWFRDKGQLS